MKKKFQWVCTMDKTFKAMKPQCYRLCERPTIRTANTGELIQPAMCEGCPQNPKLDGPWKVRIRNEIQRLGISIRQFAAVTGAEYSTLTRIVNGDRKPKPETARKLAGYFERPEKREAIG